MHHDDRVLVDFRTADDAGVYRWDDRSALVQTVDFFTPIVDDPFLYGQIAAANSLSDVYAMGARPLTALAIAGFPKKDLDPAVIRSIFEGGLDKLGEADVALLGGHTVQDEEIKFGYAVTGTIAHDCVLSNAGVRPGDVLVLTKPLGTGIVATAIKYNRADDTVTSAAITAMTTLNRVAAETLQRFAADEVHACTDITGFGLIGHASEMAAASDVTLRIDSSVVPLLEGVRPLVKRNRTSGGDTNARHFESGVDFVNEVATEVRVLLHDPQTSGGLLAAVDPGTAQRVVSALTDAGVAAVQIGEAESRVGPSARAMGRVMVRIS